MNIIKHEIIVGLTIADFDDISHQELSNYLGIIPSRIYIKGIPSKAGKAPARRNRWIVFASDDKSLSFEQQVDILLRIIEEKMPLFIEISEKYTCEFSCGLYLNVNAEESVPSIRLSKSFFELTKKVKVEFDLDILLLDDE